MARTCEYKESVFQMRYVYKITKFALFIDKKSGRDSVYITSVMMYCFSYTVRNNVVDTFPILLWLIAQLGLLMIV